AWCTEGVGADGQPFSVGGEFVEVDPPRKLVQTWRADWDGGNVTTITYRLEPIAGGTRLRRR
ncbi:MAG: SRPBCC domain-containing protein, partial [Candidatus Deferrimicrobium sp.]